MLMPMMRIRIVGMTMRDRLVAMPMRMPVVAALAIRTLVLMPMMLVVFVLVFVLQRLVGMAMTMFLGQVQPYADGHRHSRSRQPGRERFVQHDDRQRRTEERGDGKVGSSASRTQVTQAHDE
jgi:hypothetical protein